MYANNELVAQQWLRALNLDVSGIATVLPDKVSSWGAKPFIVVEGIVGGSVTASTSQKNPVVSVGVYGVTLSTGGTGIEPKPPYAKVAEIAEAIERATYAFSYSNIGADNLAMPNGYEPAWIQEVYPVSIPRRRPGDNGNYAIYDVDIQINWTAKHPASA